MTRSAKSRQTAADLESNFGIYHYRNSKLTRIARALATVVASIMPVIAILILFFIKSILKRIYVMIGFTFVFGAAISYLTPAKLVEVFAATAA